MILPVFRKLSRSRTSSPNPAACPKIVAADVSRLNFLRSNTEIRAGSHRLLLKNRFLSHELKEIQMKNNNLINENTKLTKMLVYGAVAFWFVFALVMGVQGRFAAGPEKPPLALGLTIGLPMLLFGLAYARHGSFWAFAQTLDLRVITGLHLSRIVGFVFLALCAEGRLPAAFALPAGINDIIIGLTAIPLALGISR